MNKFTQSKIYKLTSPNTENIYIGSTTERYLSSRLSKHKTHCRLGGKYTANKIILAGDVKIELLELVECDNVKELRDKERKYIEDNLHICINKNIPNRTWQERYEIKKIKKSNNI